MNLDEKYWENRYLSANTGWDLGHISRPLKDIIDKIDNKYLSILLPGAGNSYEAEYLIEKGFQNVTVLDIASQPLARLKERLVGDNNLRILQENYFDHIGSYDLILEQTFFCALETRFRESYIKKSYELLKKEGLIEGILFDFKAERNEPPYSGSREEYINLFENNFEIIKLSRCLNSEKSRQGKELIMKMKRK